MHTVPLRKAQPHDTRNMVHVRQRGHTDQPGGWELASWMRKGGVSAQMSRAEDLQSLRERSTADATRLRKSKKADFLVWEK